MAKRSAGAPGKLNVHVADEELVAILRVVLVYEAAIRGRTLGQACYELVMEAADVPSYPVAVLDRIAEIEAESKEQAVARLLATGVDEDM